MAGQPLRSQMLRALYIVLCGQKVNLVIQGRGFSISSKDQALADAAGDKSCSSSQQIRTDH